MEQLTYIPPVHHALYQNLITNDSVDDIGLLDDIAPEEEDWINCLIYPYCTNSLFVSVLIT